MLHTKLKKAASGNNCSNHSYSESTSPTHKSASVFHSDNSDCGYTRGVNFSVSDSEDNTDYVESKDESPSELDSEEDSSEGDDIWTQEEVEEVVAKLMECDKPDLN